MSVEAVVSHDAAQIGVSNEEDAEQIVNLALVPVCSVVQTADGRDRGRLIRVGLDPDSRVVPDTQHVVDDLETLVSCRIVDCCNVRDLGELRSCVVLEEGHDRENAGGRDVDRELVLPDGELLDVLWQTGQEVLAIVV